MSIFRHVVRASFFLSWCSWSVIHGREVQEEILDEWFINPQEDLEEENPFMLIKNGGKYQKALNYQYNLEKNFCPFAVITIPKSGTHLLIKALLLMGAGVPSCHRGMDGRIDRVASRRCNQCSFPLTHFWISPQVEEMYRDQQFKRIICIRDLRDVCIANVHHILSLTWPGYDQKYPHVLEHFKNLSFDDQLLFVMEYIYDPSRTSEKWQLSLPIVAAQAATYVKDPNLYVCRFENLVGEEGGGSKEAQLRELRGIADYLNLSLTDEKLEEVASNLYGNRVNPFGSQDIPGAVSTFRKGKIGGWKTIFNEKHKEVFKRTMNHALVELGYEENDQW